MPGAPKGGSEHRRQTPLLLRVPGQAREGLGLWRSPLLPHLLEEMLGAGYVCQGHEKKVSWFCEDSHLLLCEECLASSEHRPPHLLAIEDAIRHYKERLTRRSKKLRKELRAQEEEKLQGAEEATSPQQLGQLEDVPAEEPRVQAISKTVEQRSMLVADLERMAKDLDASMLKEDSDVLTRST
ncbi:E3 ubiquitin ligase TRIM40 [Dasypus novemcinctus]|uniref:E3 ubiquitin ligase TRIM40 n=1 Tax=Dasypus novemcinctus TaxID=9361 RepID=UPI0026604734|nr:E3 ubiquitin ligase TRIM40 [Dasypus novemcinctus]